MIKIQNLSFSYNKVEFINNLNLELDDRFITGLLGKNGAGKSTLLKLVTGILQAKSGSIQLFGLNYKNDNDKLRELVFATINQPKFYEHLTVKDNLKLFCLNKEIDLSTSYYFLDRYDIYLNIKINSLSTGMKQKLSLIYFFMFDYKLILLDEPIANIDPKGIQLFLEDISKFHSEQSKNFIISTHLINEFSELFDSYILMDDGKIIEFERSYKKLNSLELKEKIMRFL